MELTESVELCNLCLEDIDTDEPLQATHQCNDCNKKLCNSHLQLHKVKKSTKDHSLTPLPQLEQQSIDVNESVKEEEENYKKLISELIIKKEIILQRNDQLKLTITKVNEQLELNKNETKQHCDDLHKCIDNKMDQLLLEVDKIGKERLQSLQNEMQLLNNHYNEINNLNQLNNLNNIDILQNKIKLEREVINLNKIKVINNLDEMNEFKLNINKNNFIDLINTKLGNIENKVINNDQLLFNDNNLQNNNSNFDLIKFELISEFGGPNPGNGNDKLNSPDDIVYSNNLIYIADYWNNRILILDNLLNYNNEIKVNSNLLSLAVNSNNYLFAGCKDIIYKYNLNTLQLMNEINSNENYEFNYIEGMTCDKDNNLYICNFNNKEIIILNENNEFIRKFEINLYPRRILINNKNQIVITCNDFKIRKFYFKY